MRASGISTSFPALSRSSGQVAHVLRTRSPLSTRASPGFSFDLHVLKRAASVRPEPGSNSPSRSRPHRHTELRRAGPAFDHEELPDRVTAPFRQLCAVAPHENSLGASPCGIDGDVSRDTPALAFGVTVPFSRSRCPTPEPSTGIPGGGSASAEPTLTSRLGRSRTQRSEGRGWGPARGVRVNAAGAEHRGRTGDCMGRIPDLQPVGLHFPPLRLPSPPDGIERDEA